MMIGPVFIEFEGGSARWANVTEKELDSLLAYAVAILGNPDTIS
jgi:hypothetical protein